MRVQAIEVRIKLDNSWKGLDRVPGVMSTFNKVQLLSSLLPKEVKAMRVKMPSSQMLLV